MPSARRTRAMAKALALSHSSNQAYLALRIGAFFILTALLVALLALPYSGIR